MVNIAIVISVSDYGGALSDLPGCNRDGEAMAAVLHLANRFDDILLISGKDKKIDTNSKNVKDSIARFVHSYKSKDISEVFLYFSGHGAYLSGDFHYLFSDYNQSKKTSTSLSNSDLDVMIRSISPKLYVKVIDSCNSGISYVKNSKEIEKSFSENGKDFKKLYFMFSSQPDESSWQDKRISYFTNSFLKAISANGSGNIRYKEIADFISDDFDLIGIQTPMFVIQADFIESFCHASTELIDVVERYLVEDGPVKIAGEKQDYSKSLVEAITEDAKRYCTQSEAIFVLEEISKLISKFGLSNDISPLFNLVFAQKDGEFAELKEIGSWLQSNNSSDNYFATATEEKRYVRKKVRKNNMSGIAAMAFMNPTQDEDDFYKIVDVTETYVTGFESNFDCPYKYLLIEVSPNFPNLIYSEYYVVPIVSRTQIRLFYAGRISESINWESKKAQGKIEWSSLECQIKDNSAISMLIERILSDFVNFVESPIRAKWS